MQAVSITWRRLLRQPRLSPVSNVWPRCASSRMLTGTASRLGSQDSEIYDALYGASAQAELEQDYKYNEDDALAAESAVPVSPPPLPRTVPPPSQQPEQQSSTANASTISAAEQDHDDDQDDHREQDCREHKEADLQSEGARAQLELGIDQVGRGAVIGPIVLAAVALDENSAEALQRAGVDDKKRPYRSLQREMEMYDTILACVPEGMCKSVHISAEEIDFRRENGETLTDIETDAIATLVGEFSQYANEGSDGAEGAKAGPETKGDEDDANVHAVLRAVRVSAFSQGVAKEAVPRVASMLPPASGVDVSAIQSASVGGKSLAVSAAYVLAKTERALVMKSIERDTGHEIGSGFITDTKVDEFLTACVRRWRERMAKKQQLGIAPTSDAILGRSVQANVGKYQLQYGELDVDNDDEESQGKGGADAKVRVGIGTGMGSAFPPFVRHSWKTLERYVL